jgi:DNA (cytosine-5)-methyltransferase 1
MNKLRVLDLFSGIGGFSLGLERTGGFETVAFCEIEPFPRKVLAKHWPEVPCYEDVRSLTSDVLARDGIGVDVITGGFPCQDLSVAGKCAGLDGERSGLWSEIVRLTRELRPQYIIVENVANLLSGPSERRGGWFGRVLGDLAECGYDAEWENIPAAAVGAPHRRERAWVVAYPSEARQKQHAAMAVNGQMELRNGRGDAARIATDPLLVGQSGQGRSERQIHTAAGRYREANQSQYGVRWPLVPPVRGEHDGVSRKLDEHRISALGNAVVPQIPELIGRAILEAERERADDYCCGCIEKMEAEIERERQLPHA